ncbi:unnamed protein product [Paramecium octaurelia]|uniref:Uncharacterized protein n=1 Tax=Paramecium octaurelia TaxID=43137 RepID=A0A8S1YH51_PAROT|nr:unnamed protein product [Paramecium octaurelia]
MSAKDLPKGGVNRGVVIPLIFSCPKQCDCQSSKLKRWYHKPCGQPAFISEYGDIFCKYHLTSCYGYFIKDAKFQCNVAKKNNSWYSYKSMPEILMALSFALKAVELNVQEGVNSQQFTINILDQLRKRWYS